jgi:hypothetical protein
MNKESVELLEKPFDATFVVSIGIRKLRTQMLTR